MKLKTKVPKNKKNFWSNSINVKKEDETLFGLISIKGSEEFDAIRAGGFLINQVEQTYIDELEGGKIKLLRKILVSVKNRLLSLVEHEEDIDGLELNGVIAINVGDIIYIAKFEGSGVYIVRNGNYIDISASLRDDLGTNQIFTGSGILGSGDQVILASEYLDEDNLYSQLKDWDDTSLGVTMIRAKMVSYDFVAEKPTISSEDDYVEQKTVKSQENNRLNDIEESEGRFDEENTVSRHEEKEEFEANRYLDQGSDTKDFSDGDDMFDKRYLLSEKLLDIRAKLEKIQLLSLIKAKVSKVSGVFKRSSTEDRYDELDEPTSSITIVYMLKNTLSFITLNIVKLYNLAKSFLSKTGARKLHVRGARGGYPIKQIVVVLLILVVIVFTGNKYYKDRKEEEKIADQTNEFVQKADESYASALEISTINKTRAKSYLQDALGYLDKAAESGYDNKQLEQKKSQVLGTFDELLGIRAAENIQVLFDSINSFESKGLVDFIINDGYAYLLDGEKRNIYRVNLQSGESARLLEDGALSKPQVITSLTDGNLLIGDGNDGLVYVDVVAKTSKIVAGLSPSSIGEVTELVNFDIDSQDVVYTLRPADGRVDRIYRIDGSFRSPQFRLDGEDLIGAKDMAIDGNIYVLKNASPGIIRFFSGERVATEIVGEGLEYSNFKAFSLTVQSSNIYVLDSSGKILIIGKQSSGQDKLVLKEQLVYRGDKDLFSNFKEIHIDSTETNMYILDGDRLLKIPIK